ncbi:uncharacterized protein PGTG_16491 [Puccinia graminis f. sp. tritici CRL 75-36-700-3]|uniref:Uncharacterized protein n=1 Tax=Puccinia graminis f. sp. tritici (strain CRL 75-36-700-3 / race SCCL) TaxID=418459 RepID=E3L0Y8_PUCGT|nr:uncharacterized protein PGTG_16491 [Puccinia graminis f. sp. tritici CRL 75-36-700-3]EFP90213.1 hypothetical protein PGTG_16491 [Puccinia graminis f. sp. tritici CRL 75-36-700-3]
MEVYLFVFIVVTVLLQACTSYDTSDPNVKCFPTKAGRADCNNALKKIMYEADSSLDIREYHVERISGNCVVMVDNPNVLALNKQIVTDGFKKLLGHCKNNSGYYNLTNPATVTLSIRSRQPLPIIEDDSKFNEVFCYGKKLASPSDCQKYA